MKKKILLIMILISLFIGPVKALDIAPPEDPILITENQGEEVPAGTPVEETPAEPVPEPPAEEPKEEPEEKEETKLEKANKDEEENYLGIIVLVFLVLLFLMFSFRNQAKNSKEIIKR